MQISFVCIYLGITLIDWETTVTI